jgi:hypothetical protein
VIYPKPSAKQFVFLHFLPQTLKLELIDNAGRTIISRMVNQSAHEIDVSTLDKGMYFLKVNDGDGRLIETKKIIIN